MSSDDQTQRLLSELGLNEYESRAYLSVLEGGVMVAREISDRASIPYAKVYQTLNDLIEKLLITGDEGRPKKFRARHPKEAISDRLQAMEREWNQAHHKRKELLESIMPELLSLYDHSAIEEEEVQGVWNISGLANITTRLIKLVEMAQDNILIVTGSFPRFKDNFLKHLQDHTSVPLHLLTTEEVNHPAFDHIHIYNPLGSATIIVIDDLAMVSIAEVQKGKYSAGEYTAVLTQIKELVLSTRKSFGGWMSE